MTAGREQNSAYGLLRDSGRVLLEAAPEGMDADAIGRALAAQPGVAIAAKNSPDYLEILYAIWHAGLAAAWRQGPWLRSGLPAHRP